MGITYKISVISDTQQGEWLLRNRNREMGIKKQEQGESLSRLWLEPFPEIFDISMLFVKKTLKYILLGLV